MPRPRKKESEQKALAKIVQDSLKNDISLSDIGAIQACFKDDLKTLELLKKECTSIDEFIETSARLANVKLVAAAIEAAIGYDYEETEQAIKVIPFYGTTGTVGLKEIKGDKKIKKKHAKKNDALLKFLLANRLPDYFSDTKKVEINKKSIEIKADTEAEIRSFAGKLLNALKDDDVIEAELIDRDS